LLHRIVGAFDIARTFSGYPLLIGDEDIQIIRRIEIGLNTPRPSDKVVHNFKRGQKVRFVDDLIGRWPPGVVETLAHDGRISVEVDLMGRKVPIWVLPHQIERT
jgi:transcription antitermination factor NusG